MEFPLDFSSVLMAFGISVSGSLLQGSVGFGLGLIGVPLLVLIDPVFVPGPLLLGAFLLNLLVSHREHAAIGFTGVKRAIPGRILGAVFGAMVSLLIIGRFGLREIQVALVLFPGIAVGFFLSRHTARILDRGFIRIAILITSALSGLFVILKNF